MIRLDALLLGSVLLEPARWTPEKRPTLRVSDWTAGALAAGFDGWELWENHYLLAAPEERDRLRTGFPPVYVLNTYAPFTRDGGNERARSLGAAVHLRARACKFNAPSDPDLLPACAEIVTEAAASLAPDCRLLCECHPGTAVDTPESLGSWLRRWSVPPFDVIVHPFAITADRLDAWFDCAGDRLRHLHVQAPSVSGRGRSRLETTGDRFAPHLEVLARRGFRGSATIEFTAGVGEPPEDASALFLSAAADARWLRSRLS